MSSRFKTPPECQGQTVTSSYACFEDCIVERVYDASDGAESYFIAKIGPEDWKWYESYDQLNGRPPLSNWRRISAARVQQMLSE